MAVKTLKRDSEEGEKIKFLQEAAIMGQFKHPNVVTMYGVVVQEEPVSSWEFVKIIISIINPPSRMREAGYSSHLVCVSRSDLLKYTMLVVAMQSRHLLFLISALQKLLCVNQALATFN